MLHEMTIMMLHLPFESSSQRCVISLKFTSIEEFLMTELKTKENNQDVRAFIDALDNESRRNDCRTMLTLMEKITGEKAKMWGC